MSFSSDVAAFMETLGPFYESIEEEENESSPADSGIELEAGNINALLGNFGKYISKKIKHTIDYQSSYKFRFILKMSPWCKIRLM